MPEPTNAQREAYYQKLLNKLKQRPNFDLEVELGKLLMIHIDDFTPEQMKRYNELREILSKSNSHEQK